MADFIDRQRRSAQQGLSGLRRTIRNTPTKPLASPSASSRGYGIAGVNQAPVTMANEGKPPEPSSLGFGQTLRARINAATRKAAAAKRGLQQQLRSGVVGPNGMRTNMGLQAPPSPPPPTLSQQSPLPDPVSASLSPRDTSIGRMPLPRPASLADRTPATASLMPPTLARDDSTAELMAPRRIRRQSPLDLAQVRKDQTPSGDSVLRDYADSLSRRNARFNETIDNLDERMAQGRAEARAEFDAEQAAYRNRIEGMTYDEFRDHLDEVNVGSGNYYDMRPRGTYGIKDVILRPRSAAENLNSKMANMSPEEFKRYSFTSRESGLMGSSPYGFDRPTYSAEGSMRGRENALAAAGLESPAARTERLYQEKDARRRAANVEAGRAPDEDKVTFGSTADANNDGQISDSEMASVEARMRTRRAERLGLPTTPQEKAQAFQAQRDRRAQRREDALALRRDANAIRGGQRRVGSLVNRMTGGTGQGIYMGPQMSLAQAAGLARENNRRQDMEDDRITESRRRFDEQQKTRNATVDNQTLQIGNENTYNTERNAIERQRVEGQISNDQAKMEMDKARLRFEQKEARRQRKQEQKDKEKFEEIEDVELYGAQNESLVQNKSPVQGVYREGTGSERIENLQRMLASDSLTPSEKKRLMSYQFGITDQEQLNQLLYDSGYEGEGFAPNEYSGSPFNPFNFLNAYQSPRTYRIRDSILSNSAMAFAAE